MSLERSGGERGFDILESEGSGGQKMGIGVPLLRFRRLFLTVFEVSVGLCMASLDWTLPLSI